MSLRLRMLSVLLAGAGCGNPCQQLCDTLATLREDCGTPVSDAELQACRDAYAGASGEEIDACSTEEASPSAIHNVWTCEDINLYRDGGGTPAP